MSPTVLVNIVLHYMSSNRLSQHRALCCMISIFF